LKIENYQLQIVRVRWRAIRTAFGLCLMILEGLISSAVTRAGEAGDVEPPLAGRPVNFSGAIGSRFSVQMRAAPTQVQAEEPLILTVRIAGTGNLQEIQRPDLRRLPRFAERFHIENLPDRPAPAEKTREFDYRLRPRHASVKEIPPLPFVFFNPKILPSEKGYQTTYAEAIALTVQPRAIVNPAQVEGMVSSAQAPDSVYQLVEGPVVLRHDPPFALPGPFELGVLLIGPPMLAGLWYVFWRLRHPDAAPQARKRRSRAAQHALKALQRSGKLAAETQPQQVEAILAEYLRQRLDLFSAEPTPAAVAQHLEQAGCSTALAQEVARFFGHCDAARFAPGLLEEPQCWTTTATRLLVALEAES
jgi:hypothetical protein